jgi:hypothetical protein
MSKNSWIKVPDMVTFKFNEDNENYTLTWPNEKVILLVDASACKVEGKILSIKILTKPTIVKIDTDIETTEKSNFDYPDCDGNTYCTGGGPGQWGLAICCSTKFIVGECYGNWSC